MQKIIELNKIEDAMNLVRFKMKFAEMKNQVDPETSIEQVKSAQTWLTLNDLEKKMKIKLNEAMVYKYFFSNLFLFRFK